MRQIRMPMNLYRTPCSPAYWHEANLAMKCLKLLVFAALMIAVTRALSLIPGIPIWHTKLTWGFLARYKASIIFMARTFKGSPKRVMKPSAS